MSPGLRPILTFAVSLLLLVARKGTGAAQDVAEVTQTPGAAVLTPLAQNPAPSAESPPETETPPLSTPSEAAPEAGQTQTQKKRRRQQKPFPTSLSSGMGMGVGGMGGGMGFGSGGLGAGAVGSGTGLGGGGFGGAQAASAGLFGGPAIFGPRVNYSAVWYPSQPVRGQDSGLGMERQDLGVSMPVWGNGKNMVSVSTNVRSLLTETQAILPDTGRAFPTTLWSLGLGANYMHRFDNGWTLMSMANIGSSSDHPFDRNDLNVSVGGFVRIPSGEFNSWMLGAIYSPTSELPFPMPIASYYWQVNEQLAMNLGVPFSVRWRPINDLQFDFSYAPVRNVHSRITYRLADGLGIYTGFDWSNESYFLADRTDVAERLFYYEKRLVAGARYNIADHTAIDLSAGYAFDRFFFTGKQWSDQNHDRIDVGNTPFIALRLFTRF